MLCSYLAGVLTNLLLTPFAATVAFTPAFGELGIQMGINPLPLFYAFEYGSISTSSPMKASCSSTSSPRAA